MKAGLIISALACVSLVSAFPSTHKVSYRGLACEGDDMDMFCPEGYFIRVLSADWGRYDSQTCSANLTNTQANTRCNVDRLSFVQNLCEGKRSCIIITEKAVLGDPCGGQSTVRVFRTNFDCEQPKHRAIACEATGSMPLECPDNHVITPVSAFYGRDNSDVCYHPEAIKNTTCRNPAAPEIFKQYCSNKQRCDIRPLNLIFGDPCPGTYKYLHAEYTCSECKNVADDGRCEYLAMLGECGANPGWMIPNCRRTCTRCDAKTPECTNLALDDDCNNWADEGYCQTDMPYMLSYCRKACGVCDSMAASCANTASAGDATCDYWRDTGECDVNQDYMSDYCWKSCSRCKIDDTSECADLYNGDSSKCQTWANEGECHKNPFFMMRNCRATCTRCKVDPVRMIGNTAMPGNVHQTSARHSLILPDTFPEDGSLGHFVAFFAGSEPVTFELYRPMGGDYFDRYYSVFARPLASGYAQIVKPDRCVNVKRGDRIGFTASQGQSPIAYRFDLTQMTKATASRTAGFNGRFDSVKYPYRFSVLATYSTTPCA